MNNAPITGNPLRSIATAIAIVLTISSNAVWSQAPAIDWSLDDAIYQIDRQADNFQTGMARVESITTGSDGTEIERSSGTGFIRKDGRMRYNVDGGNNVVLVDRNYVYEYDKEAKQVNEIRLSKNRDRIEPFVRLGFSTSGNDLKDDFLITIIGEETIGDARTLVLELTPKKDRVRETVKPVSDVPQYSCWTKSIPRDRS